MPTYESGVYSFQDVQCSVTGPNIAVSVTGTADEGYSVEQEGDKSTLTMGANGDGMDSLHAKQNGTFMARLLKTSTLNRAFCNAYNYQTASAANHGQNTIVIDDPVRGDTLTMLGCAFKKFPNISYAIEGGTQDWAFTCKRIEYGLGDGTTVTFNG
ncbi:MAG: DUF3277 family protein [Bradyrhizobium sp.]|nr:DUF3277 family protein [Bradyrhizobium sp.]